MSSGESAMTSRKLLENGQQTVRYSKLKTSGIYFQIASATLTSITKCEEEYNQGIPVISLLNLKIYYSTIYFECIYMCMLYKQ